MTSATEELRKLLDERGVEWIDRSNGYVDVTEYAANGVAWVVITKNYINPDNDWMKIRSNRITPEQAVAATLGRPTWRNSYDQKRYDRWYNSLHHEGEPANFTELIEDIIWTCETVDMGPNGNTCQGVDEGEVNTESLIKTWADKAATLGAEPSADVSDVLDLLDEIRNEDRIGYDDYSRLFDAIAKLGAPIDEPDTIRNEYEDNGYLTLGDKQALSAEWSRIVTGLIAAHYDKNEERFKERAVKAAKMYDQAGKYEIAEYILAQWNPAMAFVPM